MWKLKELHHLSAPQHPDYIIPPLVHTLNTTVEKKHPLAMLKQLPLSFILVFIVCGCVPILYLMIVVVYRYNNNDQNKEGGFQKLLKDYDESEEEDELLYERYHR